ncbi:hypothetical protein [Streptomyces cacaoi]
MLTVGGSLGLACLVTVASAMGHTAGSGAAGLRAVAESAAQTAHAFGAASVLAAAAVLLTACALTTPHPAEAV